MEQAALMRENSADSELLARCRRGSREALHALFVEHRRRVYSVALNFFGGNQAQAEDVTQQVFLKLLTRVEAFRGDAEFTTWIYRITVNACVDETRKLRRFLNLSELFGKAATSNRPGPDEYLDRSQVSSALQVALAGLKPKYRVPILLKYVEGLSYFEIAEVLDTSIGTVSSRIHRGHKLLAGKLAHLKTEI